MKLCSSLTMGPLKQRDMETHEPNNAIWKNKHMLNTCLSEWETTRNRLNFYKLNSAEVEIKFM